MLDEADPMLVSTEQAVSSVLKNPTPLGGIIRYQHDQYFKSTDLSNPWIITTLWQAQRILFKKTITQDDVKFIQETLRWVTMHTTTSGVLPEQFNPHTNEPLSATPLVWSHAVYVETVLMFAEKMEEMGWCPDCQVKKEMR
jgi:GH15 family glucan-1,4-alpha-glucosidase